MVMLLKCRQGSNNVRQTDSFVILPLFATFFKTIYWDQIWLLPEILEVSLYSIQHVQLFFSTILYQILGYEEFVTFIRHPCSQEWQIWRWKRWCCRHKLIVMKQSIIFLRWISFLFWRFKFWSYLPSSRNIAITHNFRISI